MVGIPTDIWSTVKEIDLRPHRQQALNGIRIALVGATGSGRHTLAEQMRRDPTRANVETDTPVLICDLDSANQATGADLLILVIDSRKSDVSLEKNLSRSWYTSVNKVVVFINQFESPSNSQPGFQAIVPRTSWGKWRVVYGSALETKFLTNKFAPAIIETVPNQILGLGRYFPFFRVPIARHLINDTCLSNSAYALSTGLAEIVPILDLPLTITDMIVLTKNQAYLVYKLGLALGFSTRWQDYWVEFGSVLGGSFLWRQLARTLVGLIPIWGIVPKVAVSYSGTYVVGNAILQWYLTDRHVSRKQIQQLYGRAFARGKNVARNLLSKVPRPRLSRRNLRELQQPDEIIDCPDCGRPNAIHASFCQNCGKILINIKATEPTTGQFK
jgi:uncharacterized protein (DUF697 family)